MKHLRSFTVAVAAVVMLTTAACSSQEQQAGNSGSVVTTTPSPQESPSPEGPDPSVTHNIQGKDYTCAQIVGSNEGDTCGPKTQAAFNEYGANIDAFVNSGNLGPWSNYDNKSLYYEDVAFAGLVACGLMPELGLEGSSSYVEFMRSTDKLAGGTYGDMFAEGVEYLPVWFEAAKTLCPGASGSLTTGDYEAP